MTLDEKAKVFESEMKVLLDKYELTGVLEATFTDALGNVHIFPAGQAIGARFRVVELPKKEEKNGGKNTRKN